MRGLILLFGLLLNGCFAPEVIKQEQVLFDTQVRDNPSISKNTMTVGDSQLFYGAAGDPFKPVLMFIHGTPGNWQQYARYLLDEKLLQYFYVVVIDRPGWGQSTLENNKTITSFSEQAVVIAALIKQLKQNNQDKPVLLLGHSLGASVAPKVAMEYPDLVDGLLLFAGSLDPELSYPFWYNHVAALPVINWIIGEEMRKANLEIFELEAEMVAMQPRWQSLQAETLVVQGLKDTLVLPDNYKFAIAELPSATTQVITLANEGHLFPMTRRDDVSRWAICVLNKIHKITDDCL